VTFLTPIAAIAVCLSIRVAGVAGETIAWRLAYLPSA
jgi:hypothetical protein